MQMAEIVLKIMREVSESTADCNSSKNSNETGDYIKLMQQWVILGKAIMQSLLLISKMVWYCDDFSRKFGLLLLAGRLAYKWFLLTQKFRSHDGSFRK